MFARTTAYASSRQGENFAPNLKVCLLASLGRKKENAKKRTPEGAASCSQSGGGLKENCSLKAGARQGCGDPLCNSDHGEDLLQLLGQVCGVFVKGRLSASLCISVPETEVREMLEGDGASRQQSLVRKALMGGVQNKRENMQTNHPC